MLLNFSDRTRTGAFSMIWPLAEKRVAERHYEAIEAIFEHIYIFYNFLKGRKYGEKQYQSNYLAIGP